MAERCMICEANASYYFSKKYEETKYSDPLTVDYFRCQDCGFVYSQTHQNMTESEWAELNSRWHHGFENDVVNQISNQPPYAEMGLALKLLKENNIIDADNILDFAAGYGTLAKAARKYFDINISCYDKYVVDAENNDFYIREIDKAGYPLVINSAMFEHVLSRADLDEINNCVAQNGVLMLHTVICENIPADPNWFYLTPIVHCAFHTNKSMDILMRQWGYTESIYSPIAKSWFLFKEGTDSKQSLSAQVSDLNIELQTKFFHYKAGFVDYWKGF